MSDDEKANVKPFAIERAKQGRAKCQKCKLQCEAKELRIAKVNPNNPFGDQPLKSWYHVDCFILLKEGKRSKISLSSSNEIDGWDLMTDDDSKTLVKKLGIIISASPVKASTSKSSSPIKHKSTKDNSLDEFNKLVEKVANEPSYNSKSSIIQKFFRDGSNKKKFEGDLEFWLRLLIPKVDTRVYNLQDKQIVKLFARMFNLKHQELLDDLHAGDVSETIAKFFTSSKNIQPATESTLTLMEVDKFLDNLSSNGQEDAQVELFEDLCKSCTVDDIRTIIRLIKRDLKMNCGGRHVLDAIHSEAYSAFQKSRDLKIIIKQYGGGGGGQSSSSTTKAASGLRVMTAVAPMLAEACKDFDKALKKCPNGFYCEIKYDGERVQIHKEGTDFKFFSRNLKPVQEHKIALLKEYLPKAFPGASDLILDSEIIMVDTKTDELLPFGTLGRHKKEEHKHASTCLFIFDCLYYNGDDLTKQTLKERKKFLEENIHPIKHHVQLSEYKLLRKKNELVEMTKDVLKKGLEGLVLKEVETVYEPGKRRWLKVKKDYLLEGSIADTADLVVLGASFGTGKMGSRYSIFLMGCFDETTKVWKTVTKVHSGLDDRQMERMHRKIDPLMESWSSNKKLPSWVQIDRTLLPNALAKDINLMPVFEITAAEFTNSDVHTANSISMRFPRITKIRDDKSPKEATTLDELTHLFEESKSGMNIDELNKLKSNSQAVDDVTNTNNDNKKSLVTKAASTSNLLKRKPNDSDDEDDLAPQKILRGNGNNKDAVVDDDEKDLFKGFILLQTNNLQEDEVVMFSECGGSITKVSKKANLVLYDNEELRDDLDNLRSLYTPNCKHLQKSWLTQSLKGKELENSLKYFVKLRQK